MTYDTPPYEVYTPSEYVASGLPVNVTANIPTSNVSDSLNLVIGGVVGTTSTGIGTVSIGTDLVGLTNPEVATAATLLAAASFATSALPTNARGIVSIPTGEGDFLESILIQRTLDAQPGSLYYMDSNLHLRTLLDPDARRIDRSKLALITTDNPANPLDDHYWGNVWAGTTTLGKLQVSVMPGRYRATGVFVGDHYDQTGYVGKVSTTLRYPGSYDYVYLWKLGPTFPGAK